ncbi:acyl-coenzyme A thioesterase 13 isoform X1 [Leptinotarsa decemlineata]|uniref:acyl-coenzyme A thioesterase 13 isoform X1 n=1 Tax=Leptinotarsa decemlineata TaxID=7539 RepID=UPI003D30BA67
MSTVRPALSKVDNLARLLSRSGYEKCLQKVNVTHLEDGSCLAELRIGPEHVNPMGTLHGGLSATLVDSISSWALHSHRNGPNISVSVEMNMTYVKGAKEGEEIQIDAKTLKVGKTLAFLEVFIKNKSSGELLVRGSHTKYLLRD